MALSAPIPMRASIETLVVLNLGCGRKKDVHQYGIKVRNASGEDTPTAIRFINLDGNPVVEPDLVCTLGRDRIDLPDSSVHLALAFHVLEHIGRQGELEGWFQFWEELYRVMAPGGRLQFECPHSSSVWAWADPTHCRAINEYVFLYLNQEAYLAPNSAIPDYRPRFDFQLLECTVRGDQVNPEVRAIEGDRSMIAGTLVARKPFNPYWER